VCAAAGFDATETAHTLRELGVSRATAETAMTAINPYTAIDRPADTLYEPAVTRGALNATYPAPARTQGRGLDLIEQWTRLTPSLAVDNRIPAR
jgi:hypothetical protein